MQTFASVVTACVVLKEQFDAQYRLVIDYFLLSPDRFM